MVDKIRESKSWQFFLIAAIILIVPLTADVNGRMGIIRRMRQEQARLNQKLTAVQEEQATLEAELEFVTSDACVEQWARVDARMTKPGEVGFIPMFPGQQTEQVTSEQTDSPVISNTSSSVPKQWQRLFFGDATTP